MSQRLWFYLDDALAVAEHAAAASTFDTSDEDAVDEPALVLVGGDGIWLRSNGLASAGAHRPAVVYAQGAPADSGPRGGAADTAAPETAVFLPLHPADRDGLLRGMRQAAADGRRWLVASLDDDDTGLVVYPRRTLEAVADDNARWVPATVRIFGVLGPYPAQIAVGYRWFGWLVARLKPPPLSTPSSPTSTRSRRPARPVSTVRSTWCAGAATPSRSPQRLAPPPNASMWCTPTPLACSPSARTAGAGRRSSPTRTGGPPGGVDAAPPGRLACLCPCRCLLCGEPVGGYHDLDCAWWHGSREGETPRLAGEPRVLDRHAHQPGCRQAQPHPGGLFEQISAEGDVRCLICAAINTLDRDVVPSFGATTEYHDRCTGCGAGWGFCDLSAVR